MSSTCTDCAIKDHQIRALYEQIRTGNSQLTASRGNEAFWHRQFRRARCGCTADDCTKHGAYDSADVDRLTLEDELECPSRASVLAQELATLRSALAEKEARIAELQDKYDNLDTAYRVIRHKGDTFLDLAAQVKSLTTKLEEAGRAMEEFRKNKHEFDEATYKYADGDPSTPFATYRVAIAEFVKDCEELLRTALAHIRGAGNQESRQEKSCSCELRHRQWNPILRRCENCGYRYQQGAST